MVKQTSNTNMELNNLRYNLFNSTLIKDYTDYEYDKRNVLKD